MMHPATLAPVFREMQVGATSPGCLEFAATIISIAMTPIRRLLSPAPLLALGALFLAGCGGPTLFDYFNSFWGGGLCAAIVVILDIIALVELLGSSRTTGNKVLWSLFIIFFPFLGCLVYFFFARRG
jgi:hypothetical protein